jgi:hypothetical protein
MHTCSPPFEAADEAFEVHPSVNGTFGHLLIEQNRAR